MRNLGGRGLHEIMAKIQKTCRGDMVRIPGKCKGDVVRISKTYRSDMMRIPKICEQTHDEFSSGIKKFSTELS